MRSVEGIIAGLHHKWIIMRLQWLLLHLLPLLWRNSMRLIEFIISCLSLKFNSFLRTPMLLPYIKHALPHTQIQQTHLLSNFLDLARYQGFSKVFLRGVRMANKIIKMNITLFDYFVIKREAFKIDHQYPMKQLTNKKPLCYMLDRSHLVASLPFIDQEISTQVPKSKVSYLIRAEQEAMHKNPLDYIATLAQPQLTYANSQHFQKQVERVQAKFQQREKGQGKSKKKEVTFVEPPKKLVSTQIKTVSPVVQGNIITYQHCAIKNVNLELYKKFGPLILKELIEVLDKQRNNLTAKIEQEKKSIESLNQNRKYQQTQSYQRQHDIEERVKIMLNKRKKVE